MGVGCHFLLQWIFPAQRLNPLSLESPALAGGFLTTSTTWEALSLKPSYNEMWSFVHFTFSVPARGLDVISGLMEGSLQGRQTQIHATVQ